MENQKIEISYKFLEHLTFSIAGRNKDAHSVLYRALNERGKLDHLDLFNAKIELKGVPSGNCVVVSANGTDCFLFSISENNGLTVGIIQD